MPVIDPANVEAKVIDIVADALSQPRENVKPHSSLMDDLGAESSVLMDIVFRLEKDFDQLIPTEELWAGSIDVKGDDPEAIQVAVARLREKMPEFPWNRFPNGVTRTDLPNLITVRTITDYLQKQLSPNGA
jgi:acyl carrier protein